MNIKRVAKNFLEQLPHVRTLKRKLDIYENQLLLPPGHFYSPIVNIKEIRDKENEVFDPNRFLKEINLNQDEQFSLLQTFKEYYNSIPFPEEPVETKRYFYQNENYLYSDVIFLFSMMMHFRPKRIIEVGSGFSSAAMLDINEQFFSNSIDLTFIEPFPEVLKQRVKDGDKFTLIDKKVQEVKIELFQSLTENDFLFIDSTHVAKTNSDVLHEIFEILPQLKKGVKIHFHDIFFPFEYPREWVVDQNRSWNEIYLLRAFLMYNNSFKIVAFNTFLEQIATDWFETNMPLCLKNRGGSLWLEKL